MSLVRLAASFCLVVFSAVAQATHLVGPWHIPQISTALAAAAPGDVILVFPGTYNPFTATVGVTIRAVVPPNPGSITCTVIVNGAIVACPPSQTMHLVDLQLVALTVSGDCSLDRCELRQTTTGAAALSATSARISLQGCYLGNGGPSLPGAPALVANASIISAIDTSFVGVSQWSIITPPSPGIVLHGCAFHGSSIFVQGGNGLSVLAHNPVGIQATNSALWLTDSTVNGGRATELPGMPFFWCPIIGGAGELSRCTLQPAPCLPAVPTTTLGLGLSRAVPWRSGAQFTLNLRGAPNTFVGIFASPELAVAGVPTVQQPVWLDLATLSSLGVVVTDATGLASASWTLPVGTVDLRLWLQGVAFGPLPLRASPVAGGVVRL